MTDDSTSPGGYILVVEDDADLRELHVEVLEDAGHAVRSAEDGVEGLGVIERHGPPVVLVLDLRMPRMNGWDLAARVRANPAWHRISIVVVAAHYQIREEATALGAQAWLHKPVNIDDLASVVSRCYADALGSAAR